jgi:hypothetical protein
LWVRLVVVIENPLFPINYVPWSNGIHVVNQNLRVDFVARDTEITTIISENNFIPNGPPLARAVKILVEPSVKAERASTNNSTDG